LDIPGKISKQETRFSHAVFNPRRYPVPVVVFHNAVPNRYVRRSIWGCKEQLPKTPNAVREVDVPEFLGRLLQEQRAGKTGYLFAASTGNPLMQRNVLGTLHDTKKTGLHAFRRFRTEVLRRTRVPEDLVRLWLGHATETVTDLYAGGLKNDSAWRQEWCDRAGLGFSLDGLLGLQNVVHVDAPKVA
jgi:hypothetical protein